MKVTASKKILEKYHFINYTETDRGRLIEFEAKAVARLSANDLNYVVWLPDGWQVLVIHRDLFGSCDGEVRDLTPPLTAEEFMARHSITDQNELGKMKRMPVDKNPQAVLLGDVS